MKNLTKLAIAASLVGAAYYVIKANSQKTEVTVDGEDVFECDPVVEGAPAEPAEKKIEIYKQKVADLAKKTAEKANDLAKVVAEKAVEAKDFVEKKVEEYKQKDAEDIEEAVEEAAEEVTEAVGDSAEFVGDVVEDFKPVDDPVDPEV